MDINGVTPVLVYVPEKEGTPGEYIFGPKKTKARNPHFKSSALNLIMHCATRTMNKIIYKFSGGLFDMPLNFQKFFRAV